VGRDRSAWEFPFSRLIRWQFSPSDSLFSGNSDVFGRAQTRPPSHTSLQVGDNMDTTTILIVLVVLLLLGGGGFFYRRRV
jgi:LPXTG-motif cell wall-anchored protein